MQNCPRFKSGDFDVDSLCSELSAKAKCTETGVAVPKEAVEAALWKLAGDPSNGQAQSSTQSKTQQASSSTAESNTKADKPDPRVEANRRFAAFMNSH